MLWLFAANKDVYIRLFKFVIITLHYIT